MAVVLRAHLSSFLKPNEMLPHPHCFCAHPSSVLPSSPPPTILPSTLPFLSHSAFFPTTLVPQEAPPPPGGTKNQLDIFSTWNRNLSLPLGNFSPED